MRRSDAIMAPVHAPVPGKGTATNSISPIASYLSTILAWSFALLKSHAKNFCIYLALLSFLETGFNKKYIGAIGAIFPSTEKKKTLLTLSFNNNIPIGIDALSSVTGNAPKNKIIAFGDKPNDANKLNILSCIITFPSIFTNQWNEYASADFFFQNFSFSCFFYD